MFWKDYFFLALTYVPFGWFDWVPWSLQRRYIAQNGPQLEIKLPIEDRHRTRKCKKIVDVLRWRDNIRDRSGQLLGPPFPRNTYFYFSKIPKSQTVEPTVRLTLRGTPKSRLQGTPAF